jgi:glutaredoxin-related protein
VEHETCIIELELSEKDCANVNIIALVDIYARMKKIGNWKAIRKFYKNSFVEVYCD